MASHILNALTLRHDHDAAERTLHHFWDTKDLFDSSLIEEHIGSQPLLAASLFSLVACSLGLVVFAVVFLSCRLRGQCGSQKYQEYPSNSTNYAVYLMLFFVSWIILTSGSAYFVLAGAGFWSEKLDAPKPIPNLANSTIVRLSRSVISDLFSNYDYHGDFESVSESPKIERKLKRIHIRRQPLQTFRRRIEIPFRPMAEMQFKGLTTDTDTVIGGKNREIISRESEEEQAEEETVIKLPTTVPPQNAALQRDEKTAGIVKMDNLNTNDLSSDSTEASATISGEVEEEEEEDQVLVVTGDTMVVEKGTSEDEYDGRSVEKEESVEVVTMAPVTSSTTTKPPTTLKKKSTVGSVAVGQKEHKEPTSTTTTTTSQLFPEVKWRAIEEIDTEDVLDQLLSSSSSSAENSLNYAPNLVYFSLHSRFLVFVCRLAFCFVALILALVVLPTFFLIVAGTGCYIYSDHPMNRSSVSNKIGQAVTINASILLFASPCLLVFSSFALFYTHCHELLCAAIQLQHQKSAGLIDGAARHQSLLETYSVNSAQCSRSLAPVQSLLLSSLLVCVSALPCVFALFKLVKFYFRMSSEFYWNAADNFAGRQFSKQQEFPRYQSTVIYPDDELTTSAGYAVYGQI